MNLILLADELFERMGRSVLVILAAFGGFLVGHVLVGIIVAVAGQLMHKKPPVFLTKVLRIAGGLACALLIWAMFHGAGGFGLGGGSDGEGEGKGDAKGDSTLPIKLPDVTPKKDEKKEEPKDPKKSDTTTITWVKIVVLGGSRPEASEKRFYIIQDESAVTLEKAKDRLAELKRQSPKLVSYTIPPGGVGHAGKGTSVYEDIEKVAEELGLKFIDYKVVQPNSGS